jgi:nucleoside-diphosphate-sugar epimerase
MRVFVTGASGFIGSAVVAELIGAGHQVVGLARSAASAAALTAAGAEVQHGALDDLDSLRGGASAVDGVIHLAFNHDFSDYAGAAETDRRAIEAFGDALAGSDRPLVVAAGLAPLPTGQVLTEEDDIPPGVPRLSEATALPLAERGVRATVVRLPPTVHGEGDRGFVARLIDIARDKEVSAYPGGGANRWPAVHRLDAAVLFRLVLESAPAGVRVHAVDEEGIPTREIAGIIGRQLTLPVRAVPAEQTVDHFGWLGAFFALDVPASSALTRRQLDWKPTGPTLFDDLKSHYFG